MRAPLHDVRQIEMALRERVAVLARELLPAGRKDGHYWCVGDVSGLPGRSLKVQLQGAQRGLWCDYVDPQACGGDMLDLIRLVQFGGDKVAAIKWAKSWLGLDDLSPDRLERFTADTRELAAKREAEEEAAAASKQRGAKALWHHDAARPIDGTPAAAYLINRGIDIARLGHWPGSLKFHPEVWNADARVKIPAMLAMAVTPQGNHVATHRTYLMNDARRGWVKIDSPNAKKVLGRIGGAFVPIRKGASNRSLANPLPGEPVIMCEGIEDALTLAMARPDTRVVAAYSLPNLGAIVFPATIGTLIMAADRDTNAKATAALERAVALQQSRGLRVQLAMPPVGVKDWNEWLTGGAVEAVA